VDCFPKELGAQGAVTTGYRNISIRRINEEKGEEYRKAD
jgi:hypothetical protein